TDKAYQRVLGLRGPGLAIIIGDNHFITGEARLEFAHILSVPRGCGHSNFEQGSLLQNAFQYRTGSFPIVIILAVDQKSLQWCGGGGDSPQQQETGCKRANKG